MTFRLQYMVTNLRGAAADGGVHRTGLPRTLDIEG